jgi:predicted dehydrogenase
VIGENGTLLWDGIKGQVEFFIKSGAQWEVLFSSRPDRDYTYTEEIKSFFLSVESNTSPSISGEDGLKVVNIVENIKESSNSNSIVFCSK